MRVLVVGSNGYIGSNLVCYLSEKQFEVFAGARSMNSNGRNVKNVRYVNLELNDPNSYSQLLYECDTIIYLAGPGGPLREQFTNKLIQEHLVNFSQFIEQNLNSRNCPIVFASSGGTIYGRGNGLPFKEDDPLEPINPYGLLKLMSEKLLNFYSRNNGLNYISMRISNPYGGFGHSKIDQGVVNIFVKNMHAGQPISIWGDGSSIRDYIYMPDLMSAFESCIEKIKYIGPVNIGGGNGSAVMDVCDLIEEFSDFTLDKIYKESNSLLVHYSVLDISRAAQFLNWRPEFDLKNGIFDFLSRVKFV